MEFLEHMLSFIIHIDQHLTMFVTQYGIWTYALLFLIIFSETGLVVFPFLPGDSLLFTVGTIAAGTGDALNIHFLFILLSIAAITGNALNYTIGRFIGPKIFSSNRSFLFNKDYLKRTHEFYERHGNKTIIFARFIPIIRSFAPFVAGIGYMNPRQFYFYTIISAFIWVGSLLYISYCFGNLPFVKAHFSQIILAIIVVSFMPPVIAFVRQKFRG